MISKGFELNGPKSRSLVIKNRTTAKPKARIHLSSDNLFSFSLILKLYFGHKLQMVTFYPRIAHASRPNWCEEWGLNSMTSGDVSTVSRNSPFFSKAKRLKTRPVLKSIVLTLALRPDGLSRLLSSRFFSSKVRGARRSLKLSFYDEWLERNRTCG